MTNIDMLSDNFSLQVLFVITDGKSQAGPKRVKRSSNLLKAQGVNIYAIGVGDVNEKELKAIATDDKSIFHVQELKDLSTILKKVRDASCKSK